LTGQYATFPNDPTKWAHEPGKNTITDHIYSDETLSYHQMIKAYNQISEIRYE